MFEALTEKLNGVFHGLGNKGRLTEKDIDAALREVRMALLEADVNFRVAREFVATIRERVLGEGLLQSMSPGQQVIKITNEELTNIISGGSHRLEHGPRQPNTILMVGLNGGGKTTASAKIARYLKQDGQTPFLVAADLYRPAAIDQLEVLAGQGGVDIHSERDTTNTVAVAQKGIKRASDANAAWAIVDTAGRFQIDDALMSELESVRDAIKPVETLLVLDSMTGQDAVRVAEEFHERIGVTGLVLTKMDGDARGGAALSITKVTGIPIKFIGTGEQMDALEVFQQAVRNATPQVEVKPKRVGGATYQVPTELRRERSEALGMRWLIRGARARKGMPMRRGLALELVEASRGEGSAVRRKEELHRMAEANRAFVHYRR